MGRLCGVLAVTALVIAPTGCGGSDDSSLSADEYRSQLDGACETLFGEIADLSNPDLSADEAQQRADAANDAFDETLAGLKPPDELADAHEELVALGDEAPSPDAGMSEVRDYVQRNLDAFQAAGATRCTELEQQSLDQIDQSS
jgi:hypothetical protein